MNKYDEIPNELKQLNNWVCFRLVDKNDGKKPTKVPIDAKTGKAAASNNKATWSSFEVAEKACNKHRHSGIGFMFDGGGIVGTDIDHCVDAQGVLNDVATALLSKTSSYAEYSPSKTGIHILVKGNLNKAIKHSGSGVEIYNTGRYFTVTGDILGARTALENGQELVNYIIESYGKIENKPPKASLDDMILDKENSKSKSIVNKENNKSTAINMDDNEILELAKKAKNASEFNNLYSGQWSSKYSSQSEADLALCNMLAFWTGKDSGQIDRLFRSSGLMRDKWDTKHHANGNSYGEETLTRAVANCTNVYQPKKTAKQKRTTESSIEELNNCYVKYRGNGESKEITNFIIIPKEVLTMDDGGLLSAELINNQGKIFYKQFQMKDFCNVQSFKKVLNSNTLDLSFSGTENDIELIKQHISTLEYPTKHGYKGVGVYWKDGLRSEESLFVGEIYTIDSNGNIIDNIVSVAKTQTIKSCIETKESLTRFELEQVGKLFMNYNELPKTVTVLCWCAACFAKAKLWDKGIKFPILVMIGEQGSGKSSTYEKVIKPFFSTGASVGASRVSQFSVIQTASSSNCIPYAIDEYKPSTMDKSRVDLINNFLRDSYDCHEATRGNVDMTVRTFPLLCPICLIGEESPTESSIAERKVELMFSKSDIVDKKEHVAILERNAEKISSFGKAVLLVALKEKCSNLKSVFDNCLATLSNAYEERIKKNIAACLVGLYLIDRLCKELGTDIKTVFGMEKDEMKRHIVKAFEMYTLDGGTYNKTIVDKSFEVFDRMTDELDVGKHYKKLRDDKEIAFDLKSIYDVFTKYHRDHALKSEVIDYGTFTKQLHKKDYYLRYTNVALDCGVKKCFVLHTEKLTACADISNMLSRMGIEIQKQHSLFD